MQIIALADIGIEIFFKKFDNDKLVRNLIEDKPKAWNNASLHEVIDEDLKALLRRMKGSSSSHPNVQTVVEELQQLKNKLAQTTA